jgi:chromate transporter
VDRLHPRGRPWGDGAAVILGEGAFVDVVTAAIFAAALVVLYFKKLKEPYVVGLAGLIGVLVFHG